MPKILIIEDEKALREEICDWLHFEGHEVVGAENGRVGLELAIRERPDLIVCDIAMPEMDGHGVLLEVRSNPELNATPFIFLTASADYESLRRGMNLGADDYLTKPFKRADLLNAIVSRLHKSEEQKHIVRQQLIAMSAAFEEERERRLLKSRLIAMFSHDFRNPLAAILSSAELIERHEARMDAERKQRHLQRIGGSVRLLLQMLDDMLIVAEMENGHLEYYPQRIDVAVFIEHIVDEFRMIYPDTHDLTYETQVADVVETDPKLLRQITTNLISNAVKYSPPESTIIVRLMPQPEGYALHVIDEGMGIPEEAVPHLFEAFYRAPNVQNHKGTGLGLTIVREAVSLCGGKVRVRSVLNKGTEFVVELPRSGAGSVL